MDTSMQTSNSEIQDDYSKVFRQESFNIFKCLKSLNSFEPINKMHEAAINDINQAPEQAARQEEVVSIIRGNYFTALKNMYTEIHAAFQWGYNEIANHVQQQINRTNKLAESYNDILRKYIDVTDQYNDAKRNYSKNPKDINVVHIDERLAVKIDDNIVPNVDSLWSLANTNEVVGNDSGDLSQNDDQTLDEHQPYRIPSEIEYLQRDELVGSVLKSYFRVQACFALAITVILITVDAFFLMPAIAFLTNYPANSVFIPTLAATIVLAAIMFIGGSLYSDNKNRSAFVIFFIWVVIGIALFFVRTQYFFAQAYIVNEVVASSLLFIFIYVLDGVLASWSGFELQNKQRKDYKKAETDLYAIKKQLEQSKIEYEESLKVPELNLRETDILDRKFELSVPFNPLVDSTIVALNTDNFERLFVSPELQEFDYMLIKSGVPIEYVHPNDSRLNNAELVAIS
ncbi:MAG: YrzE family protein [Coriobacteriia bacterium]|nr:YrzE family protein [Coriobacteriia bacterium]